jgi:peroxiredoxin Q/BCP
MPRLLPGDSAPDFELQDQDSLPVKLSDFAGKKYVILTFYIQDEHPLCIRQMAAFRELEHRFEALGAVILAISGDSVASHKLFEISRRLHFTLLSDPKNRVARLYELPFSWVGRLAGRESFLLDREGIIRARCSARQHPESHAPEMLKALQDLIAAT